MRGAYTPCCSTWEDKRDTQCASSTGASRWSFACGPTRATSDCLPARPVGPAPHPGGPSRPWRARRGRSFRSRWTAHGVHEDRPCRLLPPAGCFPLPGEATSLPPQRGGTATDARAGSSSAGASRLHHHETADACIDSQETPRRCPLLRHGAESGARRGSDQSHGTCRGTRPSLLRVAISLKMAREATYVCAKNGRACLLGPSLSLHPCLPAGDRARGAQSRHARLCRAFPGVRRGEGRRSQATPHKQVLTISSSSSPRPPWRSPRASARSSRRRRSRRRGPRP